MRRHFYLVMSVVFWLIMAVGFADNWLFDVGQPSNADPTFLVHAFFGVCWFSLLVAQAGLIGVNRVGVHMKLGLAGMAAYLGFFLATSYIYVSSAIADGVPSPLGMLNIAMFVFATVLIGRAFLIRHSDAEGHKRHIVIGTFMLMEPGISRALGHVFGQGADLLWLLAYLVLFGTFVWYYRGLVWQIAVGFAIWLAGTANIVASMA